MTVQLGRTALQVGQNFQRFRRVHAKTTQLCGYCETGSFSNRKHVNLYRGVQVRKLSSVKQDTKSGQVNYEIAFLPILASLTGFVACVAWAENEQANPPPAVKSAKKVKPNESCDENENDESDTVCGCTAYAANKPIEDRHLAERLENGGWWFAVFDGHGGWQCSDYAHRELHKNLKIELHNYLGASSQQSDDSGYNSIYEGKISSKVVTRALKSAFERTDRQYMTKVYGAFELGFGRDTRAGCCALGVFILDGVMFVANAGDSRAVAGVLSSSVGKEEAKLIQSSKREHLRTPPPDISPPSEFDDEDLEIAALNESTGRKNSPEAQRKLRQKLIAKLFAQDHKYVDSETYDYDSLVDMKHLDLEKIREQQSREKKTSAKDAENAKSAALGSSLVNVMSYLTGSASSGGKPQPSGDVSDGAEYIAIEMSRDHNCKHPRERKLLEEAHEGELDIVVCKSPDSCYVKGKLQPTRAFGDFYLKYSEFMRQPDDDSSAGKYVPPPYTPPYITATPEVEVRKLVKGRDEFLIIATDGLWDMVSSQEAVEIAAIHLRSKGGTPTEASEALVTEALRRAATNNGITVDRLRSLRQGRSRRTKHDDISVIVVDLNQLLDMYYWG